MPGGFNSGRNKLFFFVNQEWQKRVLAQTTPQRVRVPTELERQGNFSQTRDNAGNLATIFSDDGVTTVANPLTTNSDGEYTFFAANGQYSTQVVATGYATEIVTQRTLFDLSDLTARAISDYGFVPVREITTSDYTVTAGNFGEWLDFNTSATAVCSLPDQTACTAFADGKGGSFIARQKGAGRLVFAASGSATAVNASSLRSRAQNAVLGVQAVATSTWAVWGDME
jgi:hypothetical protein